MYHSDGVPFSGGARPTLARMSGTSTIRTSPGAGGVLHRLHQRGDHLPNGHQPEPLGAVAEPGHQPHHGVKRHEHIRPAVAGTQDVPGPENRRWQRRLANQPLPFGAHLEKRAHDGRRLRHADVDEVRDADIAGGLNRRAHGRQIDGDELLGFCRTGMGVPTR